MQTVFDVLRVLVKLLGAGELHDQALEVINQADPDHPAGPGTAAPAAEGTQPS